MTTEGGKRQTSLGEAWRMGFHKKLTKRTWGAVADSCWLHSHDFPCFWLRCFFLTALFCRCLAGWNLSCPVLRFFSQAEELPRTRRPPASRRDIGRQPRGARAGLGGWRWHPGGDPAAKASECQRKTWKHSGLGGEQSISLITWRSDDFAGWKSGIVPMALWIHLYNPLRTKSLYHYI